MDKEEDGTVLASTTLGNAEEAPRDGRASTRKDFKNKALACWTINTGGLGGVWRLLNLLKGLDWAFRPRVINMQETSCDGDQWKSVERFLKGLGYRSFHTMGTLDSKPSLGAWMKQISLRTCSTLKDLCTRRNGRENGFLEVIGMRFGMAASLPLYPAYTVAPSKTAANSHPADGTVPRL